MKKIYRLISKVALQRHPVLIMGESGTGKELVARAIHTHGPWRDQPFVPVDCGALPPTLIESELFGHVKGAFTGAAQSRQGLLAAAGSGTVFLDEIGELPIELQSRLLRALQEHEIRPLGSNERIRFEARIIAATNQDLEAGIKRGAFRKDLFFRLNVVSIKMPSLRDRKEDIPALVRHFLARFGNEKSVTQISDEALGRLMSYDWPGNVRELENCIQRAVSLGSGTFIQMQDLPSAMLYHLARKSSSRQDLGTLQALEQQAIRQALQATGGDRVRAAKLLGIGKTTIYRKLKEYGIDVNPAGGVAAVSHQFSAVRYLTCTIQATHVYNLPCHFGCATVSGRRLSLPVRLAALAENQEISMSCVFNTFRALRLSLVRLERGGGSERLPHGLRELVLRLAEQRTFDGCPAPKAASSPFLRTRRSEVNGAQPARLTS